jgi:uncharacterized protein YbjT (DUF2867 family)
MILVVGATGLLGNEICRRLAGRGEAVRALVRTTSARSKVDALRSYGAEIHIGDLKDPLSIDEACHGMDSVISTASSTMSRQPGDSIESVDSAGQMHLVNAAKAANVQHFVFVSFRHSPGLSSPLDEAKRDVESALSALNSTIIQASWFMEVWLSPALGFDYANKTARIYGPGTNPISWVSFRDVAEFAVLALRHPSAKPQTFEFGGQEPVSPLEVVARFQKIGGHDFQVEHVPEETLRAQFEQATDPMQKSFAALMLGYARGDAIDMQPVIKNFGIQLASVDDYARSLLAQSASA